MRTSPERGRATGVRTGFVADFDGRDFSGRLQAWAGLLP
ncbi:hypothetical protein BXY51_005244 [Actinoplanes cyaneus]|nr:hypothetical protein [Actinoplanes cyaneus]